MTAFIIIVVVIFIIVVLLELIKADAKLFYGENKHIKLKILFFRIDTDRIVKKKNKGQTGKVKKKSKTAQKKERLLFFSDFCKVASKVLHSLGKHLIIETLKCHISVASEDAAGTAVMYGTICAGVNIFCGAICNNFKVRNRDINVYADFNEQKIKYDIYIHLKLSMLDMMLVGAAALICIIKSIIKNKKSKKAV